MIDKNLNWQIHIKLVESKISKIDAVLLKRIEQLNKECPSMIYISLFIHSCINYGDIAWASTSQTKLKEKNLLNKNMLFKLYYIKKAAHARLLLKKSMF